MASLNRALFFSFAGKYSSMLFQFVAVMVISRVLTPGELGGYSLAIGSIAIGQVLRDFGLSLYLVQEKEISDQKVQGCFTISVILCWLIALLYYFSSSYIGELFANEEITVLIKILSLNFLIIPFGTFTLSLLRRAMLFDKIMYIDVASSIISAVASIALVLIYGGVEVLAVASVLGTVTTVLVSLQYTEWRYYRISFASFKEIASFSSFVSVSNILNELRSVIPEFLIGKFSSLENVAFLSKANGTINLFTKLIVGVITPVIQPYIAKLKHSNGEMDKPIYTITSYMLVFQWPFSVFLYVFAQDIIFLLYGDQWLAVVPLLKTCCLLLIIDGLAVLGVQLLNAVGEVKYILKVSIVMTVMRILFVIFFIDYGIEFLVQTFIVLSSIKALMILYKYKQCFGLSYMKLMKVYQLNFLIAITLFVACLVLNSSLSPYLDSLVKLLISSGIVGIVWMVLIHYLNHPLNPKVQELSKLAYARFKK